MVSYVSINVANKILDEEEESFAVLTEMES